MPILEQSQGWYSYWLGLSQLSTAHASACRMEPGTWTTFLETDKRMILQGKPRILLGRCSLRYGKLSHQTNRQNFLQLLVGNQLIQQQLAVSCQSTFWFCLIVTHAESSPPVPTCLFGARQNWTLELSLCRPALSSVIVWGGKIRDEGKEGVAFLSPKQF